MNKKQEFKIWYRPQFLHSVCHVCKKTLNGESVVCDLCQMVKYCSQDHLKEDIDDHEELCESLKEAGKSLGCGHSLDKMYLLGAEESRSFRLGIVGLCSKFLGRPLSPWEIEVCLFPPICSTCNKFDSDLQTCQKCFHTKWCSDEHKPKNHDLHCQNIILFRDILQQKLHVLHPPLIDKCISKIEDIQTNDLVSFSLLTEIATSPLSILQVVPENISIVHIIGPEPHFEANNLAKWEIFLFDLIQSNDLSLVFVGPEIGPLPERKITKNGRNLKFTFHQILYHEYKGQKPDLICALNPGLYRTTGFNGKDTWSDTIKAMFSHPGVPVIITAYTEKEIKLDFKRIQKSIPDIKTLVQPCKNSFSSKRPLMNFVSDEETPIVFKNAFYTVLQK